MTALVETRTVAAARTTTESGTATTESGTVGVSNSEAKTTTKTHSLTGNGPRAKQTTLDGSKKPFDDKLSRETLKKVIQDRMGKVATRYSGVSQGNRPTLQLGAIMDYFITDLLSWKLS